MSDASFSEDESEVDDMQSAGSNQLLSILESMDTHSFQIDSYLSTLTNFIDSYESNFSLDGRDNLTNTPSSESYCSSPEKYGEVYAQLPDNASSSPHKKHDLTGTHSNDSDFSSPEKKQIYSEAQSFKSDCSNLKRKHESTGTQSSESDCFPDEKHELTGTQSSESDCFPDEKHELTGTQSSESDCFPDEKHELTGTQSSESDCFPDEKQELTDTQSFKSNYSYFPVDGARSFESNYSPDKKHQLTNAQSSQSISSYFPTDSQSLESDCSSPDRKHESSGYQLPESILSLSPSKKYTLAYTYPLKNYYSSSNLDDTHLLESICSSPPDNLYKSYSPSPEIDFSSPFETPTPKSNCYPPPHNKHKLVDNRFSDDDCSSIPFVKRRLISGTSFKSDLTFSSAESVSCKSSDSDWFPSHLRHGNDELPHDILFKAVGGCEKMLRQVIRTAYQFTRHSHRDKLTLKDLERSFKIHNVDFRSDDFDCLGDKIAGDEDESQSFTCTGKWLRNLEDMILNERENDFN